MPGEQPRFEPGTPVRGQYSKWGGARHHGADLVYLGADEHGDWLGDPVGNQWSGGPKSFESVSDNVLLVPPDRGSTAMFYSAHPEQAFELYCDITTVPVWDGTHVTAVDLDLDVIRRFDGSWFVDDEDEFAEHRVSYGYPVEVVAAAEAECARVADEIRSGATRLAMETAEPWFAAFRRLRRV
ncbi:hypothetical protein SAMN04489867_2622 [Pedococcus dokdonensis]|uniref:DUF402 domain-containing protein n=1 Tax=Pedococcus dokdonensis TaxID=443156 RepID=A0A1H0T3V8_9MICO|nr:DUF402 domain-containing protein [Pedococcus dokdonensis]SDP48420.1 hypothetical protein SAMN04489867_2622 [Pedococcus dokdonensis]